MNFSNCAAPIIERFQWQDKNCLPACSSYSFHQELTFLIITSNSSNTEQIEKKDKASIQHVKISGQSTKSDNEVKMTSMVINLAEQTNKEYKETVYDY